jgi:hypothetical protein
MEEDGPQSKEESNAKQEEKVVGKQILFNEAQRKQMERKEKFRKGFKEGVSKFGSGVWNTVKKKAQESKKNMIRTGIYTGRHTRRKE